jgi:uncharacterized protein (TIGR02145 family)
LTNDTATVFITVTNGPSVQVYTLKLYAKRSGTFTDARDGQVYRKVHIGTQTWMAQNLNYQGVDGGLTIGRCYGDLSTNCGTYGRLYQWHEAMAQSASFDTILLSSTDSKGICPSNWHLPSLAEWSALYNFTGPNLGAVNAWPTSSATDLYGFGLLPAGNNNGGGFNNLGDYTYLWTRDETESDKATYVYMSSGQGLPSQSTVKTFDFSVRCIAN